MPHFTKESAAEEVCEAFSSQINGKTFLITGTSPRGLGAKIATTIAKHSPAQLILVSRNKAKVGPVIEEIKSINPQIDTKFVPCDLSDQDSVRGAAGDIMNDASIKQINVVINNAAVMALAKYEVDNKGNEMQLSSNHSTSFLHPVFFMKMPLGPSYEVSCLPRQTDIQTTWIFDANLLITKP